MNSLLPAALECLSLLCTFNMVFILGVGVLTPLCLYAYVHKGWFKPLTQRLFLLNLCGPSFNLEAILLLLGLFFQVSPIENMIQVKIIGVKTTACGLVYGSTYRIFNTPQLSLCLRLLLFVGSLGLDRLVYVYFVENASEAFFTLLHINNLLYFGLTLRFCHWKSPMTSGSNTSSFLNRPEIVELVYSYFNIQVHFQDDGGVGNPCLMAYHPHGLIPFNPIMLRHSFPFRERFAGIQTFSHLAIHQAFPVNLLLQSWGSLVVTRERIIQHFHDDKKNTKAIPGLLIPGGYSEWTSNFDPSDIQISKKRNGFIKLARELGIPLRAVVHFGEIQMLCNPVDINLNRSSLFNNLSPWFSLWKLIHRHQFHIVVSREIEFEENLSHSEACAHYYQKMMEVYREYKTKLGVPDRFRLVDT